jgi:hypothetical protein
LSNYLFHNSLGSFILLYLRSCRRKIHGRLITTDWHYNRNNNKYLNSITSLSQLPYSKDIRGTEDFFRWADKYQQHSKDLVDALKIWADSIKFPSYEYVGGNLNKYSYSTTINEINISLLKQAKDHLEKSYSQILKMHDDIKDDCYKLCEKIQEIIKAKYQLSFESIINFEINSKCPNLKMTYKTDLTESNIYIAPYIFSKIFKNQSINPNDFDIYGQKLVYQGITTYAQGEELDLKNLKQVILELISNKDIKNKIEKYHQLHNELMTKRETLKKEIIILYNLVHGGKQLEKPKDCEICQSF